jgi:hypothetical protein
MLIPVKAVCRICGHLRDINAECVATQICRDYFDNWRKLDQIKWFLSEMYTPELIVEQIREVLDDKNIG